MSGIPLNLLFNPISTPGTASKESISWLPSSQEPHQITATQSKISNEFSICPCQCNGERILWTQVKLCILAPLKVSGPIWSIKNNKRVSTAWRKQSRKPRASKADQRTIRTLENKEANVALRIPQTKVAQHGNASIMMQTALFTMAVTLGVSATRINMVKASAQNVTTQ